jgi:hypothetical protein
VGVWWGVFAFVVWNVVFDREVAKAGAEFTRTQIVRYERGEPVATIDAAFSPRVRDAALTASAAGSAVAVVGLLIVLSIPGRLGRRPAVGPDRQIR